MSLQDQASFLKSIHPFELLTEQELDRAVNSMDISYYQKDTILVSPQKIPEFLYIIVKGEVGEYNDGELVKVYHNSNSFDADTLIYNKTEDTFKVHEELVCFEMKKADFLNLMKSNHAFESYYLTDLANRIQSAKQKEYGNQLTGFMVAKISDSYLHKPCIVAPTTSIMDALKQMEAIDSNCIIVDDEQKDSFGIVTDSVLRKNILYNDYDKYAPIGPIALRPIISIEKDDFLFNALLKLTKNSIKRIVVTEKGSIVGILEQLDILSYFANHSYLVTIQIRKAKSIEELKRASGEFVNTIKKLYARGTKIEYIAQLISELNIHVYKKLYEMVVPEALQKKACLIVMGSEGRREQILKTDQDNALIIQDDVDIEEYKEYMEQYTKTLIDFGFPRCDGDIMVSNPYWRKSFSSFKKELQRWIESPQKDDFMNLAIFFDSLFIAGDIQLINELKSYVFDNMHNKDVLMANFAKAALLFETPISMFSNLKFDNNRLDVKKGGIFAIVQGVRALALEQKIVQTETIARVRKLHEKGIFEKSFSEALIEAFDTLLSLRLKDRLELIESGDIYDNSIRVDRLNQLEVELLKDSFKIVDKFKKFLTHHFKLNMVG